jgi:hypothetical protein
LFTYFIPVSSFLPHTSTRFFYHHSPPQSPPPINLTRYPYHYLPPQPAQSIQQLSRREECNLPNPKNNGSTKTIQVLLLPATTCNGTIAARNTTSSVIGPARNFFHPPQVRKIYLTSSLQSLQPPVRIKYSSIGPANNVQTSLTVYPILPHVSASGKCKPRIVRTASQDLFSAGRSE